MSLLTGNVAKIFFSYYNHSADVPLYSYGGVVLNVSRVISYLDSEELTLCVN